MKKRVSIAMMAVVAGAVFVIVRDQRKNTNTRSEVPPLTSVQVREPAKTLILPPPLPEAHDFIVAPRDATESPYVNAAGTKAYVVLPGDTLSGMAAKLLGKDTLANRNAIINANTSLIANPDVLVAGEAYDIPLVAEAVVPESRPKSGTSDEPALVSESNEPEPATELKYTAARGDTVSNLAEAFLGSGNKTHKDAIINANASLKSDPDHLVVGKAYKIPAPNGLTAGEGPSQAPSTSRPSTEPDSDDVIAANATRSLRYTARPGDTVTSMAIELLGSDTEETRAEIIARNPVLKKHPDRLVAGQTYWIPAPAAASSSEKR